MRPSIEGGVYRRAAFFINGWLKERRSIEGGVYQRAAFIKAGFHITYFDVFHRNSESTIN